GKVLVRKQLPRAKVLQFFAQSPPCLVGIEACGSSHYWGRELTKLGHTVKLMAAQFVIPYRKRSKNDANDAEAICEAVGRPNMHFVAIKSEEQQSVLMVCVFHACRSMVSSHARPTFQLMSVRDFTACRSKTTRAAGSCPKVLSASMIVVAERC